MADDKNSPVAAIMMKLKEGKGAPPPPSAVPAPGMMEGEGDDSEMGLEAAAEDLISAVQSGDAKAVVSALRDAFEMLEGMPHAEAGEVE